MGKLVKGGTWAKEQFEIGSRPGKEKILEWIEAEHIPSQIIAGEPYVDADRFAIRDHTGNPPRTKHLRQRRPAQKRARPVGRLKTD
ncbi:hypothetical protein ACJJIK_10575 [Microbulbifer sp. ZKSA006]|uniref:hypothetical protein n=1 Tax=Microbulbifer sp. ZKSA006 TaxID=3243390 RepID=UPI004039695D